jgi:arylsulfatase A-like enzyme
VIPRTAAAWIAIQAGQYPLTNRGTTAWATRNEKIPRLRGLPALLGDVGYATSFFTPTELEFQSDWEVIRSLGFGHIVTEKNLAYPGVERPTYFGVADELMVKPILQWTGAQVQAHRPFITAIMTNVGHHDYRTPSTWKKIDFPDVSNPLLESYYNCLRYIDGVLANLMQGYKQLGVLNDTIFIFLGDHGQLFGEHGMKQTFNAIYQDGVRIPTLIYAPGLGLHPGVIDGPRQQIDVLPTVLDMLGYRLVNGRLPGVSLLRPVAPDRKLFYSSSIEMSALAVREGPYKYIYHFDNRPMEVFDLATDPNELRPLTGTSEDKLAQAELDMFTWRAEAELSMNARPADPSRPDGPWLRQ